MPDPKRESANETRPVVSELLIDGGDVVNAIGEALVLEAADAYIEHFRQGPISFSMPEGLASREACVMLRHRGFRFGANLPGVDNVYLHENAPTGSEADRFDRTFLDRFGVTVPSNAGKWQYNELQPGLVTMDYPDKILDFAQQHGLNARMHSLIWDIDQHPDWVHARLDQAKARDQAAQTALRHAFSRGIDYFVAERSMNYAPLEVLNDSLHQPGYLDVFGIEDTPWDPYANRYREDVEALRHHGGPVSGIGVQYDANPDPVATQRHSPTTIAHALQNIALNGLPIALTEFGVGRGATLSDAAEVLTDTMRLMFGYYRGATSERAAEAYLFDQQWNLTEPGKAFDALLEQWDTDMITRVDDDGTMRFHGFYGDYDVIVEGQTLQFTAEKPDASAAR